MDVRAAVQGLNGYKVPYAIAATCLMLAGLMVMSNCSRLSAIEIHDAGHDAEEAAWRAGHEALAAEKIKQLDGIAEEVKAIRQDTMQMKFRQEVMMKRLLGDVN